MTERQIEHLKHDSINNPVFTCEDCLREYGERMKGKEVPLGYNQGSSSLMVKMPDKDE